MNYTFENNTQELKYKVLREAARAGFELNTDVSPRALSKEIITGSKPSFRCCIHKERAIIRERLQYFIGKTEATHIVNIIESACEQCPIDRYTVTNACQGCISQSCKKSCPADAIIMVDNRAYINQEKCIECGRCKKACQFDAVSDVKRPCKRSCPVDAISMDENKIAQINYDKCISCGHCVYACPFGAITDTSQIYDVASSLGNNKEIFALVAPSISSQFNDSTISQVKSALKLIGFHDVIEVALGADIVVKTECEEFFGTDKEFMTTSCCTAFVNMIDNKFPSVKDNVSTTVSPMIAVANLIKEHHPNAETVFIGPCIAKKNERLKSFNQSVDYVITFEELRALLGAKEIDVNSLDQDPLNNASYFGRIFAYSGGLTSAVNTYMKEHYPEKELKAESANGAKECIKQLTLASVGRQKYNFLEGMICEGGCVHGPSSLTHTRKDIVSVNEYALLAKEKTVDDSINVYDIDQLELHTK